LATQYRRICDFLQTYCDFKVCPAAFVRAEQQLAELARLTYNLLIDALQRCGIVRADETGWRVGALNAWLWVFTNKDLPIYTIRTGPGARGHEVPEEMLGPAFDGFLIIDGGKAYECLSYAKGRCNAHLLRRAKELCDSVPADEQTLLTTLITVIQQAIDLAERRDQLTVPGYARRVTVLEERFAGWLLQVARRRRAISPELDRLVNHMANHFDEWLLFLREPELPPTNNHAERMLRPAVIRGANRGLRVVGPRRPLEEDPRLRHAGSAAHVGAGLPRRRGQRGR
jgi:hypothetical protein